MPGSQSLSPALALQKKKKRREKERKKTTINRWGLDYSPPSDSQASESMVRALNDWAVNTLIQGLQAKNTYINRITKHIL